MVLKVISAVPDDQPLVFYIEYLNGQPKFCLIIQLAMWGVIILLTMLSQNAIHKLWFSKNQFLQEFLVLRKLSCLRHRQRKEKMWK